jgi:hypothetical protein
VKDLGKDPSNDSDNPMNHPEEQPVGTDDSPRFGRLLVVLAIAVILIGLITVGSEAYFSK